MSGRPERRPLIFSVPCGARLPVFYSGPAEASYNIIGALRDRFGYCQLAAAYRSQLKARVQTSGEILQEFAAAVEQLAHQALGLSVSFIQTEAAQAFIDGVRDREVKQHLLMGGDRTLNEELKQALILGAAKAAAGHPVYLPVRNVVETPAPDGRCAGFAEAPVISGETVLVGLPRGLASITAGERPCSRKNNRRHETGAGSGAHSTRCHVFS
jgi:hypothetical protein